MRIRLAVTMLAILAPAVVEPADGPEFAVASVKASARMVGKDYRKPLAVGADRLSGRNVSLKDLLVEAYGMEPFQVGGPGWLDANEYDVEARADGPVTREQMRAMLRRLVTSDSGCGRTRSRGGSGAHACGGAGWFKIRPGAGRGAFMAACASWRG